MAATPPVRGLRRRASMSGDVRPEMKMVSRPSGAEQLANLWPDCVIVSPTGDVVVLEENCWILRCDASGALLSSGSMSRVGLAQKKGRISGTADQQGNLYVARDYQ